MCFRKLIHVTAGNEQNLINPTMHLEWRHLLSHIRIMQTHTCSIFPNCQGRVHGQGSKICLFSYLYNYWTVIGRCVRSHWLYWLYSLHDCFVFVKKNPNTSETVSLFPAQSLNGLIGFKSTWFRKLPCFMLPQNIIFLKI